MKKETVHKIIANLKKATTYYKGLSFKNLVPSVSDGNEKIGNAWNFSTAPILSCCNCADCMYSCYDLNSCNAYPTTLAARAKNLAMMQTNMTETFHMIDDFISRRRKNFFFRWHVAGDILSEEYFDNMVTIARNHPEWIFWTYTKAFKYVNGWIAKNGKKSLPKNLTVMFSQWGNVAIDNPYNMPTFTTVLPGMDKPKKVYKCPGNCTSCRNSGKGCIYGKSAWINLH